MVKKLLNVCKRAIKKLKPRKRDQEIAQERKASWPLWKKVLLRKRRRKQNEKAGTDDTIIQNNDDIEGDRIQNKIKNPVSSPSLPTECLIEVFTYIQGDLRTLNACLLVCKEWCNIVVPLYWSRPFHHKVSADVVNTYLQCLSKHEQQNIKACGIKLKQNMTPPTFRYADLLRELSMSKLYFSVNAWLYIFQNPTLSQGLLSLSLDWSHTGKWRNYPMFTYRYHTKNSSILLDLQYLSINHVDKRDIFTESSWYCKNLKTLELIDYTFLDLSETRHQSIYTLISSQTNLQRCKFFGYGSSPIRPMDALMTQSKTLTHFELVYAKFYTNNSHDTKNSDPKNSINAFQSLSNCTNLESLVINSCLFSSDIILRPLTTVKFPKLKRLHFKSLLCNVSTSFIAMIKANSTSLQDLWYSDKVARNLTLPILDAVVNHLESITTLKRLIIPFKSEQTPQLSLLLSECKNLTTLKLIGPYGQEREFKEYLPELAEGLPLSMKHLSIDLNWVVLTTLEEFFENCKADLDTFYIGGWKRQMPDVHIKLIEQYLKKKKKGIDIFKFLRDVHG
ncbi:6867_t:CDS:2 [Cetraspora pellucida]|uniref:6867_t:CDS:1 n=1 Tax=Cetraspora pellucida TaxID=1433469 RepID=A0A9N9GLI7_9GLOM|nr:6867_t:CDS:2 [Cetraspora pellucida]